MINAKGGGATMTMNQQQQRQKFGALLNSDSNDAASDDNRASPNNDVKSSKYYGDDVVLPSATASPYRMSPWSQASPFAKSPWLTSSTAILFSPFDGEGFPPNGLIGSLVREEGHVYSLAVSGDLLYTGSDSKNIRVWKNLKDFTGFKCNSGLVKAIVVAGNRIFTGHQDGKIRVWKVSQSNPKAHRRIGSLPSFKESLKNSVNPKNYVEVRRRRNVLRIRHFDAVSSMSLDEDQGILYSGSWDKTLKVWRVATSKCLESLEAHDDAVNAVAVGFGSLVFTGSADGTVKAWRRELRGEGTRHALAQTLLRQECAVTALVVDRPSGVVYCGSSDGLVNFWELRGKWLAHGGVFRGHRLAILCLTSAGSLVLSGGADRNICVWRRERVGAAHTCLSVLTGHAGPVKCLTVEEDRGEYDRGDDVDDDDDYDKRWIVYSGSLDKSVKVWRVSELKQLKAWEQQCASGIYASSPRASLPVGRLSQKSLLG